MSRVFITAGAGFIARQIIAKLLAEGHEVIATARDSSLLHRVFPSIRIISSDFMRDNDIAVWIERLRGVDILINCAGVLQHCSPKETWQIHYFTPKVIFDACVQSKVSKIIQISALGVDKQQSDYSHSKLEADNYLQQLAIDSTIIRPSLVFGAGSYGGSSLFRGLAGLPFVLPLPGDAQQKMQPIHIEDLAKIVVDSLTSSGKTIIPAVGSSQVTLQNILNLLREWLGFPNAINIKIPLCLIKSVAIFGNFFRKTAFNSTSVSMMEIDNIASQEDREKMLSAITFEPRSFQEALFSQPSQVQDRWHARLYFLKPLARYGIAFLWIWTAIISVFLYPSEKSYSLLSSMGVTTFWQPILLYGGGIFDGILGISMLLNYRLKIVANLQIALILIYTALITVWLPVYWLEPFAPIVKNIPVILLTLVIIALESDR